MKGAADLQKRMDDYEKKPFYKKKYVTNRTNPGGIRESCLADRRRKVCKFEARRKSIRVRNDAERMSRVFTRLREFLQDLCL